MRRWKLWKSIASNRRWFQSFRWLSAFGDAWRLHRQRLTAIRLWPKTHSRRVVAADGTLEYWRGIRRCGWMVGSKSATLAHVLLSAPLYIRDGLI